MTVLLVAFLTGTASAQVVGANPPSLSENNRSFRTGANIRGLTWPGIDGTVGSTERGHRSDNAYANAGEREPNKSLQSPPQR